MLTHTPSGLWAVVPLMLFDWLRAAPTHLRSVALRTLCRPAPRLAQMPPARLARWFNLLFPAFR